ncbi:MAG: hypothetical protein IPK82_00685 [Polyangiaceae bacterium]|nr:hypothetical protein [Polyangiaceae bacterium]
MRLAVTVLCGLLIAGCDDKKPEPSGTPVSTSVSTGATAKPSSSPKSGSGEIAWQVPANWKEIPSPNAMRLATYLVARADGDSDDAEMSVSRVGGGVSANIARWKTQFEPVKPDSAKQSEREVAGLKVTIYEVAGTYSGMGMKGGAPKENWALLAAIVEGKGGDPWFFKMTGPEKTIKAAAGDFDSLVNSFKPK